ncbi:MAG: ATP-binding cassette domain-containing protein [Fimbriimonadales bacterium]
MDPIIRCEQLTMRFANVRAVDGLTLSVQPGEVFGLVGPDGAGKTTTIRILCGIMTPTSGSIEVLGASIPGEVGRVVSDIGYMSQRFSLYGDLTVSENIEFFADLYQVPREERSERTERLLQASRIEAFKKWRAENLSGGMKQKLALVCTLIHTPKVLFLDEPTTGVDPVSRREFWQILYGLVAEGMTLVVSTPYMDEADRCQRLALIDKGRLITCATPKELRETMTKTVVDLWCSNPQAARSVLAKASGILNVQAFGERLHVTIPANASPDRIRDALVAAGLDVHDLRVVSPSLEDAFIASLEEVGSVA